MIAGETSFQTIASGYGLTAASVGRHRQNHLKPLIKVETAIDKINTAEISALAIADREKRVATLNSIAQKIQAVIDARASDPTLTAPGSETGLLVRKYKQIGSGANAQTVEEYEVDTGTLAELRQQMEQAARELGQREQTVTHNHMHFAIGMPRESPALPEPAIDAEIIDPPDSE